MIRFFVSQGSVRVCLTHEPKPLSKAKGRLINSKGVKNMKRLIAGIGVCAIMLTLIATQVFAESLADDESNFSNSMSRANTINTISRDGGKLKQSGNSNDFGIVVKDGMVNGLSVEAYIKAELRKGSEIEEIIRKLVTTVLDSVSLALWASKLAPHEAGNIAAQIAKANPAQAAKIAAAVVKVVIDTNPDMVSEVMGKTADAVRDKNPEMVDDIKTAVINEVKINHPELVAALQSQPLDNTYVASGGDSLTKEAASPAI